MAKKPQTKPKQLWKVQVNFTAPDGSTFDDIYKVVVGSADQIAADIPWRIENLLAVGFVWSLGQMEFVKQV